MHECHLTKTKDLHFLRRVPFNVTKQTRGECHERRYRQHCDHRTFMQMAITQKVLTSTEEPGDLRWIRRSLTVESLAVVNSNIKDVLSSYFKNSSGCWNFWWSVTVLDDERTIHILKFVLKSDATNIAIPPLVQLSLNFREQSIHTPYSPQSLPWTHKHK